MSEQKGSTLNLTLRPHNYDEVIGLATQIATLKKKLEKDVPRAIMLTGPYGTGKTTLAHIIAKEVQGWDFAGEPQVLEVNAANWRKIENMRDLAQKSQQYPMAGKYGIIILDEAQQLTKEAQQILLKELESVTSPTVWIICTTDPEKINNGVKDRCFQIKTQLMGTEERRTLVERAAKAVGHAGALDEFLKAMDKAKIGSPRKILMGFELFHNGTSIKDAVALLHYEALPEYYEVAMAIVFGNWFAAYKLWGKAYEPVSVQLSKLDTLLKKKSGEEDDAEDETAAPAAAGEEQAEPTPAVDEEDVQDGGKPAAARAIRAIVAALLKGQIVKADATKLNQSKASAAADALFILSHCTSPNLFDTGLEFAASIGGFYRVNQKMQAVK